MPIVSGGGGGGGGLPTTGGTLTGPLDIENAHAATTALKVHSVYTDAQGNDTVKVESADSTQRLLIQSDGTTRFDVDSGGADFRVVKGGSTRIRVLDGESDLTGNVTMQTSGPGAASVFVVNDGSHGVFGLSGMTSLPASAFLSAGDLYLWFDQTNGAAKLMVKAKQADGAVVTASIALA